MKDLDTLAALMKTLYTQYFQGLGHLDQVMWILPFSWMCVHVDQVSVAQGNGCGPHRKYFLDSLNSCQQLSLQPAEVEQSASILQHEWQAWMLWISVHIPENARTVSNYQYVQCNLNQPHVQCIVMNEIQDCYCQQYLRPTQTCSAMDYLIAL